MCANTPQAKGRVERMNSTLQDRLVKELRLAGISTIDEANDFAPKFMETFNERFARPSLNPHDAHRPLRAAENLPEVFTWQAQRKGMHSLRADGARKVLQGITSVAEVLRATEEEGVVAQV